MVPQEVLDDLPGYKELWDLKFRVFSATPDMTRPATGPALPKEMAPIIGLFLHVGSRNGDSGDIVWKYGTERFGTADWLTALARYRFRVEQGLIECNRELNMRGLRVREVDEQLGQLRGRY